MSEGLWLEREGCRLYAGRGPAPEVAAVAARWAAVGWRRLPRVTGRASPLREPYEPVSCALCAWAGLNLGSHHARAHPAEPPPGGPRVAEPAARQARAARAFSVRTRGPRPGKLLVRQVGASWEVWRIRRVSGSSVELVQLSGYSEAEARELVEQLRVHPPPLTLPLPEVLCGFQPVGRWPGAR